MTTPSLNDVDRMEAIRAALLSVAPKYFREFPWRQPWRTPYEVLIAEVLLKRTTSAAVARVYETVVSRFPSISALAEAPVDDISEALLTIGLYTQRAKAMKAMATYIREIHHCEVPSSLTALLDVPHIGPYAARAIQSFAFHQPAAIVDSNVERIIRRIFSLETPKWTSARVQHIADTLLPDAQHREFNFALLDFGGLVCRRIPRCLSCPLVALCDYGSLSVRETSET